MGTALAGACLAWAVARYAVTRLSARDANRRLSPPRMLASPWLSVDRAIAGSLVGLLLLVATYAAWPGTLQEIAPRPATRNSPPRPVQARRPRPLHCAKCRRSPTSPSRTWRMHTRTGRQLGFARHAAPAGHRLGNRAPLGSLVAGRAGGGRSRDAAGGLPFRKSGGRGQRLRWTSALWIVVLSLPIWFRRWLPAVTAQLSPVTLGGPTLPNQATTLVFLLGLIGPLVIGLQIAAMALGHSPGRARPWRESRRADDRGHGRAACCRNLLGRRPAILCAPDGSARSVWQPVSSALVILLGAAPLAAVAVQALSLALVRHPIVGPEPGSLFDRMGLSASYGLPILALRWRSWATPSWSARACWRSSPDCCAMPPRPPPISCTCPPAPWCSTVINGFAWRNSTRSWPPALHWPGWRRWPGRGAIVNRASRSSSIFPASRNWCSHRAVLLLLGWAWCELVVYPRDGHPNSRSSILSWSMPGAGSAPHGRRGRRRQLVGAGMHGVAGLGVCLVGLAVMAAAIALAGISAIGSPIARCWWATRRWSRCSWPSPGKRTANPRRASAGTLTSGWPAPKTRSG